MATIDGLISDAETAIDGTEAGLATALTKFKSAAALAASQRNFGEAIRAAESALAIIGTLPDSSEGGRGISNSMSWSESQINEFIARMQSQDSSVSSMASAFTEMRVKYES